jgi:uncharacterized membrane protein
MFRAGIVKLFINLRYSFWFFPALLVTLGVGLAIAAIEIDSRISSDELGEAYPRLFGAGYDGAREMLSAIAVSMITVAGVVFSITIVALSLAAGQYSPRVLRTFMSDRPNQLALGVFLGIYTYCLIVLRSVRGGDEAFAAEVSSVIGVVLALVGVGILIFFIHHISVSLQVSNIVARIGRETRSAIDKVFPRALSDAPEVVPFRPDETLWHEVSAKDTGYVERIEIGQLCDIARESGHTIRMLTSVGSFVIPGQVLAQVSGPEPPEAECMEGVRSACILDAHRDVEQDPAFGLQQLVDIALKALSTGINDTSSARLSVDRATGLLAHLADRCVEEDRVHVEDGRVLLVTHGPTFEALVDATYDPVRRNSRGNVDMALHLLAALAVLAGFTRNADRRRVLRRHIDAVGEVLSEEPLAEKDRRKVEERLAAAKRRTERDPGVRREQQ